MVDVDERGRHLCASAGVGVLVGVLVHPQRRDLLEAAVGRDQLVAVVDHRLVGAAPADTEQAGHLSDRVEVLTDTTADLASSPLGERRTWRDVLGGL